MISAKDILFIGVARRVAAISRKTGRELWSTTLSGMMGSDFVTVLCDGTSVFAHAKGRLYCLDLSTGQILWENELTGYGYGLASLCIAGQSAPDAATMQALAAARSESGGASASGD